MTADPKPHMILMLVHDRPIYTYMTLDALRRATHSPYVLTVFHHPSGNPMIPQVLGSFQARGVISEIVEITDTFVDLVKILRAATERGLRDREFFFWLEEDVVIERDDRCWIDKMLAAFRSDPRLAMVGSAIDKSDFIDPEALAAQLGRALTDEERAVIKAASPERQQEFRDGTMQGRIHNVAGRIQGLRTEAITEEVINVDARMDAALRQRGWTTRTLEEVRHRHLSLQNYYDYQDYYGRRDLHVQNATR